MSSYRADGGQDRAKAIAAVAIIHLALGAVIVSGLNVEIVRQVARQMQTFDVAIPKPPPPPPPPEPEPEPKRDRVEQGAPESRPSPSPVVAPKPVIELPVKSPVVASEVPGTGSGQVAGAGGRGTGTGNGGSGNGAGTGSGTGRFTPAERISMIPNREYQQFVSASRKRTGRVGLTVKVNTDGSPSNCRIVRSSGSLPADMLMCRLTLRHVRFKPARDPQGQPVAQDISWFPDWRPNR